MDASNIEIYRETTTPLPLSDTRIVEIIKHVITGEQRSLDWLEVVYVDLGQMCELHEEYFEDPSPTDSIALQYHEVPYASESEDQKMSVGASDGSSRIPIEGTIYQCGAQITEQSVDYGTSTEEEFSRVLIHAVLHLTGYGDATKMEQEQMRERERHYLTELGFHLA